MSYRLFFLTILLSFLLVSNMSGATEEAQAGRQTDCFIRVDTTVNLLIFHPKYRHIDLVCGKMPSKNDTTIIFCAAAAFTGKLLNEFKHSNIVGPHVCNGVHYNGAGSNSNYGLFAATDSVWQFAALPNKKLLETVASQGGMAFSQYWVIRNKAVCKAQVQKPMSRNIYRVIAELNGELVIIESRRDIKYSLFLKALQSLQVSNALYMDMGPGWNHSFYHDQNDSTIILHPKTHKYCTNWITFYK